MSSKTLHIIQKQVIDITLPDTNTALDWEINKRHGFTAMINRELEKCFDEYDKAGIHFIIEKLDVDLGVFNSNNLQAEMPARLYAELQKSLARHSNALTKSVAEASYDNDKDADRSYSEQQGKLEAMFFFLKKGYLPWWGSGLADWDETWLQKLTQNEINNFKTFLSVNDHRTIQRIATQFNDGFIYHLLQRMGVTIDIGKAWNWLINILKNLEGEPAKNIQTSSDVFPPTKKLNLSAIRTKYWFNWIQHAIGRTQIPGLHNLFNKHGEVLASIQLASSKKSSGKMARFPFDEMPGIWREELNALDKKAKEKKYNAAEEIEKDQTKQAKDISEDLVTENITNNQNKPTDTEALQTGEKILPGNEPQVSDELSVKDQFSEETDALFVNDAGLVLLHPFLPQLFRNCGWLDKNSFINDYAQTMAVYALYYLATGETEALEHKLVFHKFLAGMKWETPLEPVEPLNDKEKAACDELLKEVLQHWEPLRNTSLPGLRESFLQRSGKLEHIYSGWQLSIEQKTLDILLGRLPWGISLIKLPWMPEMLTVTWQ